MKVENAVVTKARKAMEDEGVRMKFDNNAIQLDGEQIVQERRLT